MVHRRELLPPEESVSLDEFMARSSMEQVQLRGSTGSWNKIGLSLLSSVLAVAAIAFWFVVAHTAGGARWMALVIALIITGLLVWAFGSVMGPGVRGSRRPPQTGRACGGMRTALPGSDRLWRTRRGRRVRRSAIPGAERGTDLLDDLVRLVLADLGKLVGEVAAFGRIQQGCGLPAQFTAEVVPAERLVLFTLRGDGAAHDTGRVLTAAEVIDDRVVRDHISGPATRVQ